MAKQGDMPAPRDKVLLQMSGRVLPSVDAVRPTAVRTLHRGCDFDESVIFGRRGAKPAGMAHRSATLARLSLGRAFRRRALGGTGLSLAIRGELGLPLELEFEFQTLDFSFERLVLGHQVRDRFPRGVQLTMQLV